MSSLTPVAFDGIVQQMVDIFTASIDTTRPVSADDVSEGSELLSIFEAVAAPLEAINFQIAVALPAKLFLDQAVGGDLDRLVSNFTFGQVVRVPASTAAGPLLFTGDAGAPVSQNVQLKSPLGVQVFTLAPTAIPIAQTSVTGAAQASLAGSAGNLTAGTQMTFVSVQAGITSVTVPTNWTGGLDEQSDDSLRLAVIEFLDSLARGVRPALIFAARQRGYDRAVIIEPNTGRVDMYLDNGSPANSTNLAAAQSFIHFAWKVAGARLRVFGPVDHPVAITAEAFTDGSVTKAALQTSIEAAWTLLFASKRMNDGLTRLELIAAASRVPGYNGVSLEAPASDVTVKVAANDYWTDFGAGDLFPYERVSLLPVTWI